MKIAKEFRWEMGHRLTFHDGRCINLHGHSYKLLVEFEGKPDSNGIVIDYYDVKEIIAPIIDELDHSFMVYDRDSELIEVLEKLNSKFVMIGYESTAENICHYFLEKISSSLNKEGITKIRVQVFETETTYAEEELSLT